jgi:hypothetical protein
VPVIVQFSTPATSSDQQSIQNLGGVNTGDFALIQATAITVSPDRISELANLPNVAFITLDRPVAATLDGRRGNYGRRHRTDIRIRRSRDRRGRDRQRNLSSRRPERRRF